MTTYFVDDATGSDGDAGTSEADAWQTLAKAAATIAAGDLVNVKNTNDYTITAAVSWGIGGSAAAGMNRIRGYTTTPGDGGRFVCKTSTDGIALWNITSDFLSFEDFELKHQASTKGRGIVASSADRYALHLQNGLIEGTTYGVDGEFTTNFAFMSMAAHNIKFLNCATVGLAAHNVSGSYLYFSGCGDAWRRGARTINGYCAFSRCVVTAGVTNGFNWNSDQDGGLSLNHCVVRGAGSSSDGVMFGITNAKVNFVASNSVFENWGSRGLDSSNHMSHVIRNCAFRNNTSGAYNTTYFKNVLGELTGYTGDGFPNAATHDFTPDNDANEGAALRAAGFGGSWFGTSYADVGAVQHQDSGGGGGGLVNPIISAGGGLVIRGQ